MRSPAISIVPAAPVRGRSRSFWAPVRKWLRDLFTPALTRDVEPRCLPSVAFTPSGPLVYQWRIDRSAAQLQRDNRQGPELQGGSLVGGKPIATR